MVRMCFRILLIMFVFALARVTHAHESVNESADQPALAAKFLFAPPSDVREGVVALPSPRACATVSQCALLVVPRAPTLAFGFDHGGGTLRVTPLATDAFIWRLHIEDGKFARELRGGALESGAGWSPAIVESVASQAAFASDQPTRTVEFELSRGSHTIAAFTNVDECARDNNLSSSNEVALLIDDDSPAALVVHRASWRSNASEPLVLTACARWMESDELSPLCATSPGERAMACAPLEFEVVRARVHWSDGRVHNARITRDGAGRIETRARLENVQLNFDNAVAGTARIEIVARVFDEQRAARTRTVSYLVHVLDGGTQLLCHDSQHLIEVDFNDVSDGAVDVDHGRGWLDVSVPVRTRASALFAATELWAVSNSAERLLGWIGGITAVERDGSNARVHLGCASARVSLAPDERLECRNLRVHERDGFALCDFVARASVRRSDVSSTNDNGFSARGDVAMASHTVPASESYVAGAGSHALVLTHGYCADLNPWPMTHFSSDAWHYENLNQNISNDAYAVDLALRAAQFKSFGVVAHSQGGCAALHLYTFYWSGLDWVGAGRLIQTVGTPFRGTPLAGNLAALAAVFGVQCGSIFDLTLDGAALWLSAIPTSARSRVYSHTTTFTDVWWSYDYCNLITDPFLSDPEDGVVEHSSGHILGGNNMGLVTGWCHVTDMVDPAQSNDASRNSIMNAQGAR
ncbi:MAG: hypothetical protein DWH97_11260 [Planctomycetota bacterium]|nr:MAG: hypothetical protein DWH97_11260 [Planctomycetota bacterium]